MTFFANINHGANVDLTCQFAAQVNANVGVSFFGFGVGLGGELAAGATLSRGYSASQGFYLDGSGYADLEVWGGTSGAQNIGCNSVNLVWSSFRVCPCFGGCCFNIPYPSGIQAKACLGLSLDFGVYSGRPPFINIKF